MDKLILLLEMNRAASILKTIGETLREDPVAHRSIFSDEKIRDGFDLLKQAFTLLPPGEKCERCKGSGVEPDD